MYQSTIGLEVHIELNTKSKMFCSCANDPNERYPNINVCPTCLGHPGTLPAINKEAVRKVIKTGLALNCQIPEYSKFDRKNYFYPDLPKGYQISQYDMPLCREGYLEINGKKIRIRRVHLEEDTGKLIHEKDCSLVDFNRAGIPLMELVTEPDITSAKEARKFAETLHLILHYLDVSDADMEKGQMRVEVNISLSKEKGVLGTKVEIKNLNSFKSVERAIEYEIQRQTEILNKKGKVIQETRGWLDEATASSRRFAGARVDDVKGITVSQREKEEAHDYRYFPEPDLPPLHFTKEEIQKIKAEIPELPQQRRERLKKEYNLLDKEVAEAKPHLPPCPTLGNSAIEVFVQNKDLGEYFEKVVSELGPRLPREKLLNLIKLATNYLITDLQGLLKEVSVASQGFLITPENFAEFITLIYEGKISSKIAKIVLEEMFKTGADPSHIIEEKGLVQITDETEIEKIIKEVISKNPKAVDDYKKGKANAFQFLIGQIMAQTKGKANPQIVRNVLNKTLSKV
ncbi:MAG: Asp-tRNA(Asn)/Glu-tRNA(Gln) amidotransferase subunit GatB [Candidatus Nealsonbacteria bacterium]|nr:Asp-tRNA(Asn)/Glu-tRNA(Gln) amidotransferase subunit GatB [Candidatus Nealsonbacteria bacterium]